MKLKDFCAILSLENQTGHCYRSVDRTADVHRCAVCIYYIMAVGGSLARRFVGVQLIFWSFIYIGATSRWELLKQPWD